MCYGSLLHILQLCLNSLVSHLGHGETEIFPEFFGGRGVFYFKLWRFRPALYWSFPESTGVFDHSKSLFWESAHPETGLRPLLSLSVKEQLKKRPDWNRNQSGSLLCVFNSHTHMPISNRGDLDFRLWCCIPWIPMAGQEQRGHFKALFFF